MMMGPDPINRILWMSSRRGTRKFPLASEWHGVRGGVCSLIYSHFGRERCKIPQTYRAMRLVSRDRLPHHSRQT